MVTEAESSNSKVDLSSTGKCKAIIKEIAKSLWKTIKAGDKEIAQQ